MAHVSTSSPRRHGRPEDIEKHIESSPRGRQNHDLIEGNDIPLLNYILHPLKHKSKNEKPYTSLDLGHEIWCSAPPYQHQAN
jgi:hypothetical protein